MAAVVAVLVLVLGLEADIAPVVSLFRVFSSWRTLASVGGLFWRTLAGFLGIFAFTIGPPLLLLLLFFFFFFFFLVFY